MFPSWPCILLRACLPPIYTHLNLPVAFPPSSHSPARVQASASTWLLNLSLSPVLKPTSEGKLNILRAVCWCLYLIKCTDEVLIYCWAVFALYYKEITQLEWDQAGNTVSRFHNLMAKRKQEPRGGWRRVGDYGGGLSWHKHDNIQEARSPFNIAASMLTTNTQASCLSNTGLMSWNSITHRWWIFPKHQRLIEQYKQAWFISYFWPELYTKMQKAYVKMLELQLCEIWISKMFSCKLTTRF